MQRVVISSRIFIANRRTDAIRAGKDDQRHGERDKSYGTREQRNSAKIECLTYFYFAG